MFASVQPRQAYYRCCDKKAPIAITDMNRLSGPLMAQYLEKAFKFWVHNINLHLEQIHPYSLCNVEISQLENRRSTLDQIFHVKNILEPMTS